MEPVTTAIVAAVSAGVAGGTKEVVGKAISDTYDKLKGVLLEKFGAASDLVEAVDRLEKKPDSSARVQVVQEEVVASRANEIPEVLKAANTLLDQIKDQPGGEQHIQTAIGSCIAQADQNSTATVNINRPLE
jgi:hypothetical protein